MVFRITILCDEELDREVKRVYNDETARDLFFNTVSVFHQRVYELRFNSDWMQSTCSCLRFMLKQMCKHVIAVALLKRVAVCPSDANPTVLCQKPKRGRKPNAKGALYQP